MLVFAASIGLKVRILPVSLQWYEPLDAAEVYIWGLVQKFGKLAARRADRACPFFSSALEDNLRKSRSEARTELIRANNIVKEKPVHIRHDLSYQKARLIAGLLSARNGSCKKSSEI